MLLFSNRIHKQNKTVGAEGGTRTPTGIHPLDPEPSASTSSATSADRKAEKGLILQLECII
jgi:hypothetical protein